MRFGPYLLESRLAVGGTAEVYLARLADPAAPQRRVIVKRLLPDFLLDEEARGMFEREAQLHTLVKHENVVEVIGSGKSEDGEPFLAMEYVDGVDGYRLLRRVRQDGGYMPPPLAAHIAREVLRALVSVHTAVDAKGRPLGIVHRDVTPSNIYLSRTGRVKLGDFGIAASSALLRHAQSAVLKGKFGYLAPEQVANEPFDHRADLFSVGSVLAEMLIGEPLFGGGGQLAVLLAIRDCRLDALAAIRDRMPPALFDVLLRALTRDPDDRFLDAQSFADALLPILPGATTSTRELTDLVQHASLSRSAELVAVRDSTKILSARPIERSEVEEDQENERPTGEYTTLPSFVRTARGETFGPWTFARLIEALATGKVGRGDDVDYMTRGLQRVEEIAELSRFLPPASQATRDVASPTEADAVFDLSDTLMLDVLLDVLEHTDSGVLMCERDAEAGKEPAGRKELYVVKGRLHHVASSNASELLGEYLVRRGKIAREELDMALAVLPRNQGRMGDTLISLGLVSAVDIFQAIREQGRDRVADVFMWRSGRVKLYRGQQAHHVEFPLDLDLPGLILAGMEAALPGEAAVERYRSKLHSIVGPGARDRPGLANVKWPPQVSLVEALARRPRHLSELLSEATRGGHTTAGNVLRSLEMLVAAHLVAMS